ncbi:hypothetical protein ASPCADRAFT_138051 [Aspergillus carbonarius ITEM 5010]|uniref:RING-type domain-containing protein n=1 Tax=Aspergillus carbonarius (strain ITEM 5010) TaxID=602072 RepID=A0A1R3RYG7_ASPC5|nr:hypothetical protein ASPCADRAFT_138051 [Aspergillus carbonarius ITEM 5010]
MSTEPHPSPGLGDLEKELTCSICTDLLYQPLTLLDCLHTFCGSCLKEWFSAQASRARSSVRFTCPSCRAVVRETRPNATVTTLLDMVLTASPDRDKSAEEKEEIAQRYKHGDSVFPTLPSSERSTAASDEEDRRLLEEVRELSLQESRARTTGHRSRQSSRTRRTESADVEGSRRRREEERAARRRPGDNVSERTRRIEHQSSLRSLLSLSDTEAIQEEILRQILEEGLLDDIDMDNLGPAQEEELSERIADAYRRRHRLRARSQQRPEAPETRQASSRSRARSQSVQRPQESSTQNDSSRNPPVSRPYLLDPLVSRNGASGHQRRLSEQGSSQRRTSPVRANPASSSEVTLRPAARSSSDVIVGRPRNSQAARVRNDSSTPRSRRATASEQNIPNIWVEGTRERAIRRPGRLSIDSPRVVASPEQSARTGSWPASPGVTTPATAPATSSLAAEIGSGRSEARSRPSSSRSNAPRSTTYKEPSISCDRCGRGNIQYDLHKQCANCKDGEYHLCVRCYRTGRGCLNWAGFRASAEASFERIIASSSGHPQPSSDSQQHILRSCQYRRAADTAYRADRDGRTLTTDDPAHRLTTGFFCDSCLSPANDCYWKCNQCNEGDWGFCNRCVNQGRCCTHALLPICRMTRSPSSSPSPTATNNSPSRAPDTYKILSIATNCDICAHPIPDSTPRFHCLQCNDGDYDICTNCYLRLVAIGKIRKDNGHNGWRRCLKGHRMVVIGFEEHEDGQRRVIVRDLVGGRALNDDHLQPSPAATPVTAHFSSNHNIASPEVGSGDWSWKEGSERRKKASRMRPWTIGDRDRASEPSTPIASPSPFTLSTPALSSQPVSSTTRRYPPDGGVGLIVHALWSWYPEDGVKDELMFPRGAEITEAENINDDWYWGCYAGLTGLFPGAHVFVAGEVA